MCTCFLARSSIGHLQEQRLPNSSCDANKGFELDCKAWLDQLSLDLIESKEDKNKGTFSQ